MKILGRAGHTLVEILVASLLIGAVFLIITSLYVSGLKFLKLETNSQNVDIQLAFETLARNAGLAEEAIVDASNTQLKLRIDPNNPATPSAADDKWITYRFISVNGVIQLRSRTVAPPNAVPGEVSITDPEIVPGVVFLLNYGQPGFWPGFYLLNPTGQGLPTLLQIRMAVNFGNNNYDKRVLLTSVALRKSK